MKLPVINFRSKMKENTPQWEYAKNQIAEAIELFGCFEATYDNVPLSLSKATISAIEQLYDLPSDVKLRYTSDEPFIGYNGKSPYAPFMEVLGIPDVLSSENLEKLTTLMWPKGNSAFSETIRLICERLSELDKIVMKMVLEIMGLNTYIDEHIDSTRYVARVQKYVSLIERSKVALRSHIDKNYVTILHQNEVNGLEVMTRDGQWFTFNPSSANSFVVLIGDSLRALTNGRLRPSQHRVVACDKVRYTIGLFASPKLDYTVKVLPEMVDDDHPLLYKPYTYGEYLNYLYSESMAGKNPDDLKEYCGVH